MNKNYESPTVETMKVEIEKGVALSGSGTTEGMTVTPGTWN